MHPLISLLVHKTIGTGSREWEYIKTIRNVQNVNCFINNYALLLTLFAFVLFVQELELRRMCPIVGLRIPSEQTPLLGSRFPRGRGETSNLFTILVVGCLILVLAGGAMIGIYLLFIQHSTEMPPVIATPFLARSIWQKGKVIQSSSISNIPGVMADCVVFTQTDSGACHTYDECVEYIESLEYKNNYLPYNYIISTEGVAYEYLGTIPSDYIQDRNSIVLAFIGNYTYTPPSKNQIVTAKRIIDQLVNCDHLAQNYTILGKDKNDLKHLSGNPANLSVQVDKLMFVVLTRMFSNFTEAVKHM